jgi:hypothetical protein
MRYVMYFIFIAVVFAYVFLLLTNVCYVLVESLKPPPSLEH